MKFTSKTGNILTSLIVIAVLIAAFLYWKTVSDEQVRAEKRGFLTYEEHVQREGRKKSIAEARGKVKAFFEKFKGR